MERNPGNQNVLSYEVHYINPIKGRGLFATKSIKSGENVLQEIPASSLQHVENRSHVLGTSVFDVTVAYILTLFKACENCCKFLGTINDQLSMITGVFHFFSPIDRKCDFHVCRCSSYKFTCYSEHFHESFTSSSVQSR